MSESDFCEGSQAKVPKPPWLKVALPSGRTYQRIRTLLRGKSLHTVCEEAMCPNVAECWGCGTATFLILGNICTRSCGFCAVTSGRPAEAPPSVDEARQVAEAAATMGLKHAVITSVTRDDLPDGGAALFAETITRIHGQVPNCTVELLIPDFLGRTNPLKAVIESLPEILGHNMETVPRLYPQVRPQADYRRSLRVLQQAKEQEPDLLTKSGIMVGLGENTEELIAVFSDLRQVGCDILTVGQYLRPTRRHLPVVRYYAPEEFADLKEAGRAAGFRWVESGPLVRSSYHADQQARALRRRLGCSANL
jgi:lipoyl synthase